MTKQNLHDHIDAHFQTPRRFNNVIQKLFHTIVDALPEPEPKFKVGDVVKVGCMSRDELGKLVRNNGIPNGETSAVWTVLFRDGTTHEYNEFWFTDSYRDPESKP